MTDALTTPPPSDHDGPVALDREVELWCRNGQHAWTRPRQTGRPPYSCPEHRGRIAGGREQRPEAPDRPQLVRTRSRPAPEVPAEDADGRLTSFTHLSVDRAGLYRLAVSAVAGLRRDAFLLQVRPAEIAARLEAEGHDAETAAAGSDETLLDKLVEWGNLTRIHDTSAATSLSEFARRRSLYQLTPAGEAAHRAVEQFLAGVDRGGRLSRRALNDVLEDLTALAVAAAGAASDPARVATVLAALLTHFDELAHDAGVFLADVQRTVDRCASDSAAFRAYKQELVAYIQDFVTDLVGRGPAIAAAIRAVEDRGLAELIEVAASVDQPPTLDEPPPDPVPLIEKRWAAMRAWFITSGGAAPTAELLRGEARRAVNRTLSFLEQLNEARAQRVSRTADLVRLARWIEAAGSDREGAHIFAAAFGLGGWRHLGAPDLDDSAAASTSWRESTPVTVLPRLVGSSPSTRTPRSTAAEDFGAAKGLLAQRLAEHRARAEAALARFVDRGPFRLSTLDELSDLELRALLELVDRPLAAPPDAVSGARRARSRDGRSVVTLVAPADGSRIVLRTPLGRLDLPDYLVEAERAGARRRAAS